MEHKTLAQVRTVARVHTEPGAPPLSRSERLERWAELLARHGGAVRALRGTEYVSRRIRRHARADGSAISLAHADPVLRSQGLAGDCYGDAVAFFKLTDGQAHRILCDCHYGAHHAPAPLVAQRIREAVPNRLDGMPLAVWAVAVPVAASGAVLMALLG